MTDAPHLDEEQLSAVLDGDAPAADVDHTTGCARCSARLDQLRAAVALVATPPPAPSADARDRAIAAAIAARVVPLRRSRWEPPTWLRTAAVILVVVALSVPLLRLLGDSGGGDDDSVASSDLSADDGGDSAANDEDAATSEASAPPVDGGDLGPIEAVDLRGAVTAFEGAQRSEAFEEAAPSAGGAGEGAADAPADTTAAANASPLECEGPVREGDPALGAVRYLATGTFGDVLAAVLAFDRPAEGQIAVYVLAVEDCRVLNFTSFPA